MNTIMGVVLSVLAGMILWAVPRLAFKLPSWGLRAFWVAVIAILVLSTRAPDPYNLGVMGVGAGMAVFENLYHRHRIRAAARKAANSAKLKSQKPPRRKSTTGTDKAETP